MTMSSCPGSSNTENEDIPNSLACLHRKNEGPIQKNFFLKTLSTPAVHSCHDNPAPPLRILLVDSGVLGESVLVVVDDVMVYGTQRPWGELCGAEVPLAEVPLAVVPLVA
jgi:hypothetical protein